MKKIFALLLALFLFTATFPGCAEDTPELKDPNNEENQPPVQDTENPATDFEYEKSTDNSAIWITKYIGTDKHVIIPSQIDGLPVVTIKYSIDKQTGKTIGAFQNSDIQSVVIPDSVKAILTFSFYGCTQLSQVTFGQNSQLGNITQAFSNCTSLEKIDLSTTKIVEIGEYTFSGCTNLNEIRFPDTLIKIGKRAFYQCSSLIELPLPKNLETIEAEAFGECTSLKTITIPTKLNLSALDATRFYGNSSLEKVIFEDGREKITGYAFFTFSKNVEIILPNSIKKFSPWPFIVKNGTSITITFLGDAPEITDEGSEYWGDLTIYYNPATRGWDTTPLKDKYPLLPIAK